MGEVLNMDYNKTIEDIIFEQEAVELMALGSLYEKQLMMESWYMEEETPSTGEAPKVGGVNALQRFWNWLRRCINVIKTKIAKFFANKKIERLLKALGEVDSNKTIEFNYSTYMYMRDVIEKYDECKDDKKIYLAQYNPKGNYQKFANEMKDNASLGSQVDFDLSNSPTNKADKNGKKAMTVKACSDFIKKLKEALNAVADSTVNVEKFIKEEKNRLDEDTVKSNNFQQYIRWMTEVVKFNLRTIRTFGDWCSELSTGMELIVKGFPYGMKPKLGFDDRNCSDWNEWLNKVLANELKRDNAQNLTWVIDVNGSSESYQKYVNEKLLNGGTGFDPKDYNILIFYLLAGDGKWKGMSASLPKDKFPISELKKLVKFTEIQDPECPEGKCKAGQLVIK